MTSINEKPENPDQLYYKDVFDEILDHLNEEQLNELILEIENQKQLLKIKSIRWIKMKQEIREEKKKLMEQLNKDFSNKNKKVKDDFSSEEEERSIQAPKKKVIKK